jgi:hypothetical protein
LIFDIKTKKWYFPHGEQGKGEDSAMSYLKERAVERLEEEKKLRKRGCIK